MTRKFWISIALAALPVGAAGFNYFSLQQHVDDISRDPRNDGIRVWVHYRYFAIPSELVFDIRSIDGEKSAADVTRVLLTFASSVKDTHFSRVVLESRGEPRFLLTGEYFQQLGEEFGTQNVVYTIRTLPENVYTPDGRPAFSTWTGGLLGVLGKQMEDFLEFHRRWYIHDMGGKLDMPLEP